MGVRPRLVEVSLRVWRVVFGVLASAAILLVPIRASSASSASSKTCISGAKTKITDSTVCKGLAFYKGTTITFVTGTAGSATDQAARAMAPLLGQYLGATVNVSDQGQANGFPGQDSLASASPTGLEIGFVNVGSIASLILTNQPGVNFNPGRLSYIAGEINTPSVLVSTPSSGITTFAQLRAAATSPESVKLLGASPSTGNAQLEVLFNMLGMNITWVSGYSNTAAVVAGFYRGDGSIANDTFSNLESLIQGESAIPLATSVPISPGMPLRGLIVKSPSYTTLLKTYGPKNPGKEWIAAQVALNEFVKLGQPLVTQTKVASYKVETLRAAAQWAFAQRSFKTADLAAANNPAYVNPVTAKSDFNTVIKASAAFAKFLPDTNQ